MTNPRLDELRAKFHENPRRYFAPYANELRKTGDPSQAIAVCRAQLATQPAHVSGHIVLGQALYEAGDTNEARDIFTAALELDPENLIALRSLGEIAQVNGEFVAARQWYQRLLDADPRNSEVAELLRDIPAEAPPKPLATPALEPMDEPTPFTVREEIAAAEAPTSAPEPVPTESGPKVHTGFTGPGPAYKTAEDERDEALAKQAEEALAKQEEEAAAKQSEEAPLSESEDAFIDLQLSAYDQGGQASEEGSQPVSASTGSEPLEMLDIPEATETFAANATQEPMSFDSFDLVDAIASDAASDSGVEPESGYEPDTTHEPTHAQEAISEPEPAFETEDTYTTASTTDATPSLEIEEFAADAFTPAASSEVTPSEESPPSRATFAERGFDGSVDEMGWMTTPSQAFSDLEAAPESWLDEESAPTEPETVNAQVNAPEDQATDSWFDEAPGATTIEATEITSDELWLPPELPNVPDAEANAPTLDESQVTASASSGDSALDESWSDSSGSDTSGRSASVAEEHPVASAPNAIEADWSQSTEPAAPSEPVEAVEPAGITSHDEGEPQYADDEAAQPVEAESAQEASAAFDSVEIDVAASTGDVEQPVEAISASTGATESTAESSQAEYDEHRVIDVPTELVFEGEDSPAPAPGSAMGQTPTDAVPAATPAPFLTETLAELYLQQGFREEALSIYRQLLDRNPTDDTLTSRIAALEKSEVRTPTPVPAETRTASQSVRTFFSRLARRPAAIPSIADRPGGGGAGNGDVHPEVPFQAAASALANLFSASRPPQADEGAASTLAGAFTDPAGRPSRTAERELSLDHLFRDVAPGGSAAGGVTLDEFYSTPNSDAGSTTEPGAEAEDSGGTDIRQFTAWLEGLRKK